MRKSLKKLVVPLALVAMLLLGVVLGIRFSYSDLQRDITVTQRWSKLNVVLNLIKKNYVDTINEKTLEENSIAHLLKALDPHSTYISASQMNNANEALDGSFEGIGITFNMLTDTVVVVNTINGGPSQRVGVWAGDKIICINDSVVAGKNVAQDSIVRLLRGKGGTKVKIDVKRAGEKDLLPFTITRGKIPIKSVEAALMLNSQIGYIKLSQFSRTTHAEFMSAVERLQAGNTMQSLVLDLRGNTGGFLDQAFDVANEFFEKGTLLVYTEGKMRPRHNFIADGKGNLSSVPLAVLIDEGSASASEIVAGAIQDNDRGWVIGRRSFGKGLVQEPINFNDGSGIRLTVARYYTPTGRCIQRPYTASEEEYYGELVHRYEHGEMTNSDSIVQNKSLQYTTPQGKIVYGGGGITPDVFVAMDTLGTRNPFVQSVFRKNLPYKFALQYADAHRAKLQKIETLSQLKRRYQRYDFVPAFVAYAAQQGVETKPTRLSLYTPLLNAHIKAYIGRSTHLDDNGFYTFLVPVDNTIQTAIQTLKNK
ncbi:peptidase S41 [Bacteroidia bacterium]|nr:peptidase S41 [Bacteroidia bacterium]